MEMGIINIYLKGHTATITRLSKSVDEVKQLIQLMN